MTVANPSVPLIDLALTKDVPVGIKIFKAKTFEPSYASKRKYSNDTPSMKSKLAGAIKKVLSNILLPDIQILWWPGLAYQLFRILRKEKPSCIFVSAPPFSTFIPVVMIGSMLDIPVVIDYRDEWDYLRSQYENLSKSYFARKIDFYFEKYCVRRCSAFTAASESYIENLADKYHLTKPVKGVCITNGFDEEDFAGIRKRTNRSNTIINVVFSGTVWQGTSLKNFFCAIEQLLEMSPSAKNKLRIKIFGRIVDSEMAYLNAKALKGVVEIGGYIEHNNIIDEILDADILLMSIVESAGAERIILGKIFEYMATGKHILALLPAGESERLLKKNYANVTIVKSGDINKIQHTMLSLMENIDAIRASSSQDVSQFSRRKLTEKLSGVFNSVTSG